MDVVVDNHSDAPRRHRSFPDNLLAVLGVTLLVLSLAGCTGSSGSVKGFTPIVLPTFHGCQTDLSSSAESIVVPIRVIHPNRGGAIIVAGVCVDGHGPFSFIVDTGASTTTIDSTLAARLHLRPVDTSDVTSFTCLRAFSFAQADSLSVDGLSLDKQVVDVGTLRSPLVPGLMGLLGSDTLSRFAAVRIDFDADRLTLVGPEGPLISSVTGDGRTRLGGALVAGTTTTIAAHVNAVSTPIPDHPKAVVSEVRVEVPVTVGDHPGQNFAVDTGAERTVVSPSLVKRANLHVTGSATRGYGGLACPIKISYYALDSWKLNGVHLVPQVAGSNVLPPGIAGLLGSGTLQDYSPVVVDYRDGDLLLGPLNQQ